MMSTICRIICVTFLCTYKLCFCTPIETSLKSSDVRDAGQESTTPKKIDLRLLPYAEAQKVKCHRCITGSVCKLFNRCSLCEPLCKLAEQLNAQNVTTTEQSISTVPTETELSSKIDENLVTDAPNLGIRQTFTNDNNADSDSTLNQYYTLGHFQSGPLMDLLFKALNISDDNQIEKVIVLAQGKTAQPIVTMMKPQILDTAKAFNINDELVTATVYSVKNGSPAMIDKLNKILEETMANVPIENQDDVERVILEALQKMMNPGKAPKSLKKGASKSTNLVGNQLSKPMSPPSLQSRSEFHDFSKDDAKIDHTTESPSSVTENNGDNEPAVGGPESLLHSSELDPVNQGIQSATKGIKLASDAVKGVGSNIQAKSPIMKKILQNGLNDLNEQISKANALKEPLVSKTDAEKLHEPEQSALLPTKAQDILQKIRSKLDAWNPKRQMKSKNDNPNLQSVLDKLKKSSISSTGNKEEPATESIVKNDVAPIQKLVETTTVIDMSTINFLQSRNNIPGEDVQKKIDPEDQILNASKDNSTEESNLSISNASTKSEESKGDSLGLISPNGKLMPGIGTHKVYFIGNGVKLPLLLNSKPDGSFQIKVDVNKMCECQSCKKRSAVPRLSTDSTSKDDSFPPLNVIFGGSPKSSRAMDSTHYTTNDNSDVSKRSPRINDKKIVLAQSTPEEAEEQQKYVSLKSELYKLLNSKLSQHIKDIKDRTQTVFDNLQLAQKPAKRTPDKSTMSKRRLELLNKTLKWIKSFSE